jgi:hypothetical protein
MRLARAACTSLDTGTMQAGIFNANSNCQPLCRTNCFGYEYDTALQTCTLFSAAISGKGQTNKRLRCYVKRFKHPTPAPALFSPPSSPYHMAYAQTCPKSTCARYCDPIKGWGDSYAVGGRCYCSFGGSAQDHGVRSIQVTTSVGYGQEVTVTVVRLAHQCALFDSSV